MKIKVTQPVQVVHDGTRYTIGQPPTCPIMLGRNGFAQIPAQICTNRRGAQMPIETFGLGPFQTGGGGGGGGGGDCSAATHVLDGASYAVPWPHSAALLTAGDS